MLESELDYNQYIPDEEGMYPKPVYGVKTERIEDILRCISVPEESSLMQGLLELSTELSMAQETTFPQPILDQFAVKLMKCMNMDHLPEVVRNY